VHFRRLSSVEEVRSVETWERLLAKPEVRKNRGGTKKHAASCADLRGRWANTARSIPLKKEATLRSERKGERKLIWGAGYGKKNK